MAHPPIPVRTSEWTPRQKQVLDLLVRGYTNTQIATTLDISLDGAKWHVSEIITRLGVSSRNEAADYWRAQTGLKARFFSAVRAITPDASWTRWLAGAAATGLALGLAGALILALPNDETNLDAEPQVANPSVTDPASPSPGGGSVLTNGQSNYAYEPALSYVAPGGEARLINLNSSAVTNLLQGCEGLGSAKQGDVQNGGLRWSKDGSTVYCLTESLSVIGAKADGSQVATLYPTNGCPFILDMAFSPDGAFAICQSSTNQKLTLVNSSGSVEIPSDNSRFSVSPAGNAFIAAGPVIPDPINPAIGRGSWNVWTPSGDLLGSLPDAYVGYPSAFAWTIDGTAFAYPGVNGLTIVDLSNGWQVVSYPVTAAGQGPKISWVLDDSALLVHGADPMLVHRDGTAMPVPANLVYTSARIAPDGQHLLAPRLTGSSLEAEMMVVDLASNSAVAIPGSRENLPAMGLGPQIIVSGDSSRACWVMSPVSPAPRCADLDGSSAFTVKAPYQVEPNVIGNGDYSVLWRAFSPDLLRIAYTTPGLADPSAQQVLWVSDLDGSNAVRIGEAQGVLPYEWQPDSVYRQPGAGD